MSIVLARVDNRLIHGQVLEAWVPRIHADCIVVANDEVSRIPFQKTLMQAAVPSGIRVVIGSMEEVSNLFQTGELDSLRVLLLLAGAEDALKVHTLGIPFNELNLGNMHGGTGKVRYTCTIALDPDDIDNLKLLEQRGVRIFSQCIPSDRERCWEKLIRKGRRMITSDFFLGGGAALLCGLDRTAIFQFMISRPIVAAPLTGFLMGDPLLGLKVGALLELLWLGRLPVGASIPPDDTQVAVGATVLSVATGKSLGIEAPAFFILCVVIALPLGKVGQIFDRMARHANGVLLKKARIAIEKDVSSTIERYHLLGFVSFAAASIATYLVIVFCGYWFLKFFGHFFVEPFGRDLPWLQVLFPLIGSSIIVSTMNVRRAMTLFGASFTSAMLMLWLS